MSERTRWWWALLTVAALGGLGIVEAARTGHLGLLGLLGAIELVTIVLAWSLRSRSPVPVRGDLMTWLETTAAITGESPSELADRAVSSYRATLHDDRDR